ncbi:MAG: M20/M25/M40 family metallo-hydrolase, partial [Chloroflexota bacterium]
MSAFPIDRAFIIRHLTRMVQIESINPGLVPGGAGEGALAAYIAETLRAIGVETIVETVEPGRDTVIGRLRGGGNGPSLMLNAHTDTVGVGGMAEPFSGAVREGRLYGRGSFDMKGSIAACLAMLDGMVRADVRRAGDLLFTAVVDEEYGSKGMEALVRSYRTDAAIVTEPTGLRVCCAQRGFVWIAIETIGRAAHGSRYMDGIDANAMMGRVLVALDAYGRELLQRTGHPLLGPPSVHVPLIQGGTSQSVYAAHCRLEIERRTVPGDSPTSVLAEVQAIIDRLAAEDTQFRATVTRLFDRPPYEIDPA